MGPLLGLLGLAGGALGQDWYFAREARQGQEKLSGLLGRAPDWTPDGGYDNPDPGSGLMRDPGNIQAQLEFVRGVMGMAPRQQAAIRAMVEPIMARAASADMTREGWGRQERFTREGWAEQRAQSEIGEANVQRRFEVTETRINEQHADQERRLREVFEFDKQRYGEEKAWQKYTFGQEMGLRWAAEARQRNAAQLEAAHKSLEIEKARRELAGGGLPRLSPGYEHILLPTGVMTDKPLAPGQHGPVRKDPGMLVARPVAGTPDWVKADAEVRNIDTLINNVESLQQSVRDKGTQMFGPEGAEQGPLYSSIVSSIGSLRKLGTLQEGDLKRLTDEIPNPAGWSGKTTSSDRVIAALEELRRQAIEEQRANARSYRGWNLNMVDPDKRGGQSQGRAQPPEGSRALGGR